MRQGALSAQGRRWLTLITAGWLLACLAAGPRALQAGQTFTVATYNLENYVNSGGGSRPAKSEASKASIREILRTLAADVLALQEIGGTNALTELRASLKTSGLEYPYWEHVNGWDTNIQVAVLSRFPIVARRSHTQDNFLLNGRRFRLTRGIGEVEIQVSNQYSFTLFVAHFKSRRAAAEADEADIREQEALVLREKIDARLRAAPDANIVVVGDLNDVKDSRSTRAVIGKGRWALVDTRPAEKTGDPPSRTATRMTARTITWTHYYAKEDTYSRIDYILVSRGMAREWDSAASYVLTAPNWGLASDHRPLVAGFSAEDR